MTPGERERARRNAVNVLDPLNLPVPGDWIVKAAQDVIALNDDLDAAEAKYDSMRREVGVLEDVCIQWREAEKRQAGRAEKAEALLDDAMRIGGTLLAERDTALAERDALVSGLRRLAAKHAGHARLARVWDVFANPPYDTANILRALGESAAVGKEGADG